MGAIRIVSGIFDDTGECTGIIERFKAEWEMGCFALGKGYADRIGKFSGYQRCQCGFGGRRRTCAGGPAAAELPFRPVFSLAFHNWLIGDIMEAEKRWFYPRLWRIFWLCN